MTSSSTGFFNVPSDDFGPCKRFDILQLCNWTIVNQCFLISVSQGHFHGGKRVPNDPPGREIQCSTVFNQCSTHLRQLEPLMAKYGNFGPKLGIFGAIWGTRGPFFWGQKGSIRPPRMWNTMFNRVQPMFNPFEAAGTTYGQIWQFWAEIGHKMAINGLKIWKMVSLKVEHIIT